MNYDILNQLRVAERYKDMLMQLEISELEQFETLKNITKSIDHLDKKTLKEILAYILKIYIIDKEIEYEGIVNDNIEQNQDNTTTDLLNIKSHNFVDLIYELKSKYSIPELDCFLIEDDKVYIQLDGKRHLLSKKNSKESFGLKKKPDLNLPKTSPERFKNLEMDG